MLPPFNAHGDLPPGIHKASWAEVGERFGSRPPERGRLFARLKHLHELAARTGKLSRLLVFGSFVSAKELPGDLDLALVMAGDFRLEEAPRESQTLLSHPDAEARFGASVFWLREGMLSGELMALFLDTWQSKRDGTKRGIIEVQL